MILERRIRTADEMQWIVLQNVFTNWVISDFHAFFEAVLDWGLALFELLSQELLYSNVS